MRTLGLGLVFVTVFAAACGTEPMGDDDGMGSGSGSGSGSNDPDAAFTVTSKDVTIAPGEEITYCYYFHTPNTSELAINKWVSDMTPGSHHMIMFFGDDSQPADGTLDPTGNCGGGGFSVPVWVYATQTPHGELPLPTDDGTGKPLGMNVPANKPAYFQMHYLNSTDEPITAHVTLSAYALDASVDYTPTAAFVTYNGDISIPANATNYTETETCNLPAGAKFWTVSTHSHKQSVKTKLEDGGTQIFLSEGPDAWEHPGSKDWGMPFYTFASGTMTYSCTYDNPTSNTIVDGPSAQTNEMCMGTGYFFPATTAKFCYTNQGPF